MASNPSSSPNWTAGAFNGSLLPIIEICPLAGTSESAITKDTPCASPAVSAHPAVSAVDEMYKLNWLVPVNATTFYRISVKVGTKSLGFADMETGSNGSQLKNVNTGEFVPLVDGRTLPIKFRIENYALCDTPGIGPCASSTLSLGTGGTVSTTLANTTLPSGIVIPPQNPPAGTDPVTITVQGCITFNDRATDLPVFGPCVRVTSDPALSPAGFTSAATVFICDVSDLTVTQGVGAQVLDHDQADRITLHRLDPGANGPVMTALPHVGACGGATSTASAGSFRGMLAALRHGEMKTAAREVAAMLSPEPLYAARFIDLGGGGLTAELSDFQFALPAKMEVVQGTDRQDADPGAMLPNPVAVRVSDVGDIAVRGARVTFAVSDGGTVSPVSPSLACPAGSTCVVKLTGEDGIASTTWELGGTMGENVLSVIGRGIAGSDQNGPRDGVDPFQPIQSHFGGSTPPGGPFAVNVLTGKVLLSAMGWHTQTVCSDPSTTSRLSADNLLSGPAFAITPNAAYAAPIGASKWIGPVAGSGTSDVPVGSYEFRTTFIASPNAQLSGSILADNGATLTLNGAQLLQMGAYTLEMEPPMSAFQNPSAFSTGSNFTYGTNTLNIQLLNTGFSVGDRTANPAGMSFCFTVSRAQPPATPGT